MNKIYSLETIKKNFCNIKCDCEKQENCFFYDMFVANSILGNGNEFFNKLLKEGYSKREILTFFSNDVIDNHSEFYRKCESILKNNYNTNKFELLVNIMRQLIIYDPLLFLTKEELNEIDSKIHSFDSFVNGKEFIESYKYEISIESGKIELCLNIKYKGNNLDNELLDFINNIIHTESDNVYCSFKVEFIRVKTRQRNIK